MLSLGHKDWIHANAGTAVIPAVLVAGFVGQGLGPGDWGSGQEEALVSAGASEECSPVCLMWSGSRQLFGGLPFM